MTIIHDSEHDDKDNSLWDKSAGKESRKREKGEQGATI